jgi:carboxyl-terminal processing protease
MQNFYKVTIAVLVGLFVFGLGVGVGHAVTVYFDQAEAITDDSLSQDFGLLVDVWRLVENQFYGGVPAESNTTYGAIRGALSSLNDPYTIFVEPQPRELERAELDGQHGGIGAGIYRDEANQVHLKPLIDSPAERAGILETDVLIKVDEVEVQPEMSLDEIRAEIIGEVGTEVSLTFFREGQAEDVIIVIKREVIETPSVEWRILEEDQRIGYIKVRLFSNRTNKELQRALDELKAEGASAYLVDLRGNGGGLLDAAVDVASQFLRDGLVLKEDRRGEDPKIYEVRKGGKLLDQPLAVLVDAGTASASEIVAGAIQDHQRAPLIGERTYGKGSVQLVYDLPDASSLHVTVAKWFTPNNSSIDGAGLTPDIEVLFTEEDHAQGRDPQFARAIEYLQSQP